MLKVGWGRFNKTLLKKCRKKLKVAPNIITTFIKGCAKHNNNNLSISLLLFIF
jgi:hypothetical protein